MSALRFIAWGTIKPSKPYHEWHAAWQEAYRELRQHNMVIEWTKDGWELKDHSTGEIVLFKTKDWPELLLWAIDQIDGNTSGGNNG